VTAQTWHGWFSAIVEPDACRRALHQIGDELLKGLLMTAPVDLNWDGEQENINFLIFSQNFHKLAEEAAGSPLNQQHPRFASELR